MGATEPDRETRIRFGAHFTAAPPGRLRRPVPEGTLFAHRSLHSLSHEWERVGVRAKASAPLAAPGRLRDQASVGGGP